MGYDGSLLKNCQITEDFLVLKPWKSGGSKILRPYRNGFPGLVPPIHLQGSQSISRKGGGRPRIVNFHIHCSVCVHVCGYIGSWGWQSSYGYMACLPARILLNAPSGTGKTVALTNLVLDIYKGCFEKIYIFSPTIFIDDNWTRRLWKNTLTKKWTSNTLMKTPFTLTPLRRRTWRT